MPNLKMRYLNVLFILSIALVNELQINNESSFKSASQLDTQAINNCPREFAGWYLIKSFETKNYTLVLCQKGNFVYLVGHEKQQHEAFITASVISQNDDLILAQDKYGFSFKISDRELKITRNEQLIAQEKILNSYVKQDKNNSDSNLTGVVWQLQQIRYSNNELI